MEKNVTGRATVLDDRGMFMSAALATGSTDGAIKMQEAMGASDVRHSDRFPLDRRGITDDQLIAIGCTLGPKIDDLFQSITLPPGWKKDATGHDMWTYIVDEKGRKRFSIFYKAAFYDRSAHANAERRYGVSNDYEKAEKTKCQHVTVTDGGKIIKRYDGKDKEPEFKYGDEPGRQKWLEWRRAGDALTAQATAYLDQNFPDWKDWTAYWNS